MVSWLPGYFKDVLVITLYSLIIVTAVILVPLTASLWTCRSPCTGSTVDFKPIAG